MPDLVVEQVSISWLPEQGDGFAVFECRVLAIVGVPARVVTSGDDLSNAVLDGICLAEWEEYVQYEAGNGNVRIVARHVVGKRKVNSIVCVPSSALSRLISKTVLRHEMAVGTKDGFCNADDGFSHDDVSKDGIIFVHPHHAEATDVVALLVTLNTRIFPFPIHCRSQSRYFFFCEHIFQEVISVPVELINNSSRLLFIERGDVLPNDTSTACWHNSLRNQNFYSLRVHKIP